MNHQQAMHKALFLAQKGKGHVAPNPLVGCVIMCYDKIIAEGYHENYGGPHAEVNAINALPANLPTADCLLYVALEPCSHFGKTAPCADLIIKKGFKKVVIAIEDPNPKVKGRGIQKLKDAGIEVIVGVLEQEAKELNKAFFIFHQEQRPYVILKWAQTIDGFISRLPIPKSNSDNKISGLEAHQFSHQLRSQVMAIMVGKNTVLNDNPQLTTRLVSGNHPIRVVIDKNLEIQNSFQVFSKESKTLVFNAVKEDEVDNIQRIQLNFNENIISQMLEKLYQMQIHSVLVEGGSILLQSFIDAGIWDEAYVFENPNLSFETGIKAPVFEKGKHFEMVGKDRLFHLRR